MAVRMLRLGDETGQLPMLTGRVAEFYEAKLQRALDGVVGIAGPAAIAIAVESGAARRGGAEVVILLLESDDQPYRVLSWRNGTDGGAEPQKA